MYRVELFLYYILYLNSRCQPGHNRLQLVRIRLIPPITIIPSLISGSQCLVACNRWRHRDRPQILVAQSLCQQLRGGEQLGSRRLDDQQHDDDSTERSHPVGFGGGGTLDIREQWCRDGRLDFDGVLIGGINGAQLLAQQQQRVRSQRWRRRRRLINRRFRRYVCFDRSDRSWFVNVRA